MKRCLKLCLILTLILICSCFSVSKAIDTNAYKNIQDITKSDYDALYGISNRVLGVTQVIGVATATIMLILVAIKYFTSSASEKATIKESIIGYVIGAIILFGVSGILALIEKMVVGFRKLIIY